jgi:BON domain
MRIPLYVLGFGFALSVTLATGQTAQQPQTPPINPSTPANQIGDGAQSKSGTPVSPSSTAPSTTGGVAGSVSAPQSPEVQNSSGSISAMTDSDLQSQIQNALSKEPTLTGDSAHATVSGDTIELAGTVGTNKEKITATRIVQSYGGSKKLVNKLTVGGRSDKPSQRAPSTDNADRQPGTANPANNPEPSKGTPPSSAKPPHP